MRTRERGRNSNHGAALCESRVSCDSRETFMTLVRNGFRGVSDVLLRLGVKDDTN
jgi:hypothetical protein